MCQLKKIGAYLRGHCLIQIGGPGIASAIHRQQLSCSFPGRHVFCLGDAEEVADQLIYRFMANIIVPAKGLQAVRSIDLKRNKLRGWYTRSWLVRHVPR